MDDASRWCAGRLMIVILIALYLKVCQLRCYLLVRFTWTVICVRARIYARKYMIRRKREKLDAEDSMVTKFQGGYIAYDTAERRATVSLVDICIVGEISLVDHRWNGIQKSISSNLIRLSLGQHRDSIRKLSRFCQLCLRQA